MEQERERLPNGQFAPRKSEDEAGEQESQPSGGAATATLDRERGPHVGVGLMGGQDYDSGYFPGDQPPPLDIPGNLNKNFEYTPEEIKEIEKRAAESQLEELIFQEEPVAIYIQVADAENPEMFVEVFINGEFPDVFDYQANRWVKMPSFPVECEIVTRRKWVDALANMREDKVKTKYGINRDDRQAFNRIERTQTFRYPFTIRKDWYGIHNMNDQGRRRKAQQWFNRVMAQRR